MFAGGGTHHSMKIYAFVAFYPSAYKPYLDAHFADLVSRGFDLRIFALGCLDSVWSDKVRTYELDKRTEYFYPDDLRSLPRFVPRLLRRLGDLRQAVHISSSSQGIKGRVKGVARILSLPADPPDLCLVHDHHALHLLPWLRRLFPKTKIGLFYYGGDPAEASALSVAAARGVFQIPDLVFALTQYCAAEALDRGAPAERTRVHPLGFDLRDFPAVGLRKYRPDGRLRLATAGRVSLGKGHQDVLRALAAVKRNGFDQFIYSIIGDGPLRGDVEAYVQQLGLGSHVRFLGAVSNQVLIQELAENDVLILASFPIPTWTETQGAVVQEAMLMRNLVITTRTGGVPESIPPFMQEYAVNPRDVDALANAIRRVATLTLEDMASLGARAREWVEARYDVRILNERVLNMLTRVDPSDSK